MATALNPEQFANSMKALFQEVAKAIPEICQERAIKGTSLIVDRIRQRGLMADENAFPAYSKGYKKYREDNGRQTTHVDLSFTGRMLNNLKIVSSSRTSEGYVVEVFATGADEIKKLNYNDEHYGDILKTSKKEDVILTQEFDEDIQAIIDKNGFGK